VTYLVVFDTNILISALLFPSGSPFICVSMARDRRIQSITCQEILNEFSEKLIQKFTLSEERAEEIIQEVRQFSQIVKIDGELALVSADPDDDMIVECAIAGNATHIITGDKHLLSLVEYQNIQIVKAKDFLDFLDRNNNHEL
jgi:putative PIN family toxin of toxin-antitoxin system